MSSRFEDSLFIKSIEKGFAIIELFESVENELSLSEISKLTGYGISGTQRLLYTLEKLGYIEKNQQTKKYTPGIKTLKLGFTYNRLGTIQKASLEIITEMVSDVRESVFLLAFNNTNLINIMHSPSEKPCPKFTAPGTPFDLIYSAAGRSVLSHLPAMKAVALVFSSNKNAYTKKTITDPKLILKQIETAYTKGFSIIDGETDLGTISIGSAILDKDGSPIAALEMNASRKEWKGMKQREQLGAKLEQATKQIGTNLG